MISASLTSTLRPIRIAFVIPPWDRAAALRAMQISSFLWGGTYNPIIPYHRRIDRSNEFFYGASNAREVFEGYLQAYDPDFVVRLGGTQQLDVDLGRYREIKEDDIVGGALDDGTPGYGIGLFEILGHLLDEEFRYVHRDQYSFDIPEVGDSLLWTSFFGGFSENQQDGIESYLKEFPGYRRVPCNPESYLDIFRPENHFLRELGNHSVECRRQGHRDDWVYLMDGSSVEDVVFYWNLRALGWRILPVPMSARSRPKVLRQVEKYVEENYWPYRGNPSMFNHTALLKAPSVSEKKHEAFAKSLKLKPTDKQGFGKLSIQSWIPRFWSEWDRRRNGGERRKVTVEKKEVRLTSIENRFYVPSLLPVFAAEFSHNGTPRCANDLEPRVYGQSGTYAEAIPEGGDEVARALDRYSIHELRCSADGLVYYPSHRGGEHRLELPLAEPVFKAWFKERGWETELSDSGHIVKHVLKQFGGIWGTNLLTAEEIFEVLTEIMRNKWLDEANMKRLLHQCSKKGSRISADRIMKWFIDSNIIKLGVELTCPQCRQSSWYSVAEADYELECRQCLENFKLPSESLRGIKWAYRGQGAFASREASQGAIAVILTLRLFSRPSLDQITPILSFNARKGREVMEIDLALHTRKMRAGSPEKDVLFVECKSRNEFARADIDRMETFTRQFPGTAMVFSTLRRSLNKAEITMLTAVAKRSLKARLKGGAAMPVIILTGNELFSSSEPRQTWEELGGKYARYGRWGHHENENDWLAEATQYLYLDFDSNDFINRQRRSKAASATKQPKKGGTKWSASDSTV